MPFVKTYDVDFANGNLHPNLNLLNWPDLTMSGDVTKTTEGLILHVVRGPVTDENLGTHPPLTSIDTVELPGSSSLPKSSVFIKVPGRGLPLDTRLFMSITFDLPNAEEFLPDNIPVPPVRPLSGNLSGTHGPFGGGGGIEFPGPEPWAVVLSISPTSDLSSEYSVHTTCQFHKVFNCVRLNTPSSQGIRRLQSDQAAPLESPLNYSSYRGGYTVLPNGSEIQTEPPLFTLSTSFCGWDTIKLGHSVGCGFLKISRSWRPEVEDHRVFSNNSFIPILDPETPSRNAIRALGISVATQQGIGRMSARIRSFSLSFNNSITVN